MASVVEPTREIEKSIRDKAERHGMPFESYAQELESSALDAPLVLLTGFGPFGEYKTNPSHQIAEYLDGQTVAGARIVGLTLPVAFGEDTARVFAAIDALTPRLVLSLGLHAGRPCLDVERFAVNLRASNEGDREHPIIPDGPAAYFSTMDVDKVGPAIAHAGVPVQPHGYAGNYLCNHILYQVLHYAAINSLSYHAGFIHLPLSTEIAVAESKMHQASLPLETMIKGVQAAIERAVI